MVLIAAACYRLDMLRRPWIDDAVAIAQLHRESISGLCSEHYDSQQIAVWLSALPSSMMHSLSV